MKKSMTAFLLVLAMMITMTTVAFAADAEGPRLTVTTEVGDGLVTATVYLENGEGLTNGRVAVSYDREAARLEGAQALVSCGAASVNKAEEGTVSFAWVGSSLTGEKTALVRLTFTFAAERDLSLTASAPEAYAGKTALEVAEATATVRYNPFTDIDNHWAREEILTAYHAGIFQGVNDTIFAPDMKMNRAMFVTVLYRMAGEPAVEDAGTDFTDVKEHMYYTDAVAWAAETGITNGVGDGLFAPYKLLSRQEAATMLCRYAQASGRDVSKTADLSRFADSAQISGWAEDAMSWAVAEGLLKGYPNGLLAPGESATRGEAAAILVRYAGICEEEP